MEATNRFAAGMIALLSVVAVVLAVITMSVCFSIKAKVEANADSKDDAVAVAATNQNVPDSTTESKKALYRLVSEDGIISVKDGEGKTLRTLNVPTAFLPEEDRNALKEGIEVFSEAELAALIGDYEN